MADVDIVVGAERMESEGLDSLAGHWHSTRGICGPIYVFVFNPYK
jgi:hypothetical protein